MRQIFGALTGLLIVPQVLAQEHDHAKMGGAEKPPMVSASKQRTCPVTGKAAREDVFVQEGRLKVYLSSPDCVAKFKDSPAKHLPNVYKQIYPQTVQVKCLVSGDPVEPMKSVDFIGARIDFCCDQCPEDFKADPAKYLVKMKSASTEQVHCPVTGGPIDPRVSAQYSGKTLYFSSADAMTKFKAAPAKYMERLRSEAGVLARGATADEDLLLCAVAPPEKAVRGRKEVQSTTYRGKTYFLGSDEDVDTFKARPAEYAAAVDETMKAQPRESAQWFTCSMHPEVLQKGPGKCPKCGMDLTPVKSTGAKGTRAGHAGHDGKMGNQQRGRRDSMMMQGQRSRGHGGMMGGRGGGGSGSMMPGQPAGDRDGGAQGQQDAGQGGTTRDPQNGGHPGCRPLGHDHQ